MRPSSSAAPRRAALRSAAPTGRRRARRGPSLGGAALAVLGVLAALVLQTLPAAAAPAAPGTATTPASAIEALAPYQGQSTCDPVARPGAIALRTLVMSSYSGTGDSGIIRGCDVGAESEHKEGRAWDWRVSASNPAQVAQVADLTGWLLATDQYGNTAAMARRLGIMYMIWNSRIWKSYQASRGWQPYSGASPHTDHVHFSLSWAGAYGQTSYWTGSVAPTMYAPVQVLGSATATASISLSPAPVADHKVQRRIVLGTLHGPWRRH